MISGVEDTRQEASMKQIAHTLQLRSMIEKLVDQLDGLEALVKPKDYHKKLISASRNKAYDPELLDEYELNWKSLNENYGTYQSPMSQLKGLKKRAPGDK